MNATIRLNLPLLLLTTLLESDPSYRGYPTPRPLPFANGASVVRFISATIDAAVGRCRTRGPELVPPSEYMPEIFGGEMTQGSGRKDHRRSPRTPEFAHPALEHHRGDAVPGGALRAAAV